MTAGREWYAAAELAALDLQDMPNTVNGVNRLAKRERWRDRQAADGSRLARRRPGRGGGWEYHFNLCPPRARMQLIAAEATDRMEVDKVCPKQKAKERLGSSALWARYDALPDDKKREAQRRLLALDTVNRNYQAGASMTIARDEAAILLGCTIRTIQNWQARVDGLPRSDWLPALVDDQGGGAPQADCDPAAWQQLKDDYLRPEQPSFAACYRRLSEKAKHMGWRIPSKRALQARLRREIPEAVIITAREGTDAMKRLYPAQERIRDFHALEALNADGHQLDVLVRWPNLEGNGFTALRPILVAIQDLGSGKILAWRLDVSENTQSVRLAIGDVLRNYGVPERIWLDNGRAFASKDITGGAPNRFRFKVREDDPTGVLVQLGVQIHWTTPAHGQAKPIERAFRDFADHIARHPDLAGAYTGNAPHNKPANYGAKPAHLDVLRRVLDEGIAAHNRRPGRRTRACQGKLSFDDAFASSYEQAAGQGLIRRASAEQIRQCLLAGETVTCQRTDGTLRLHGNRYWSEALIAHRGDRLLVRFDPDALHDRVEVYRLNGAYIGPADCYQAVGFADQAAAKRHAADRKRWAKVNKERLALERRINRSSESYMPPAEIAETPLPEPKVLRMVNAGAQVAVPAPQPDPDELPQNERGRLFGAGITAIFGDKSGG